MRTSFSFLLVIILLPQMHSSELQCYDSESDDFDGTLDTMDSKEEYLGYVMNIICKNFGSLPILHQSRIIPYTDLEAFRFSFTIMESNISRIDQDIFQNMPNIIRLNLTKLQVETLSVGAFNGLKSLKILILSFNEIEEINNGVFNFSTNLKEIFLDNNRISKIGKEAMLGLAKLQLLDLTFNRITRIDLKFPLTTQKLKLDLSDNPITDLYIESDEILQLILKHTLLKENKNWAIPSVKKLDMAEGQLEKLKCGFLPKTTILELRANRISFITDLNVLNTEQINLEQNNLAIMNDTFPNKVTKLILKSNRIRILKKMFLSASRLSFLDVSFNNISTITNEAFEGLTSLEELNINNNHITELNPVLFKDLTGLKRLNLSNNQIGGFTFGLFDSLTKLEMLDVSGNKLKSIDLHMFHSVSNLTFLSLDYNEISHLDVANLENYLKNLKTVSINGNFFTCQALESIDHYLSKQQGTIRYGSNFHLDNYHGITCINTKDYELELSSRILQKIINESVQNSKMEHFFKEYFNRSGLLEDSSSFDKVSSAIFTSVLILFTIIVIVFCYIYLKRMKSGFAALEDE